MSVRGERSHMCCANIDAIMLQWHSLTHKHQTDPKHTEKDLRQLISCSDIISCGCSDIISSWMRTVWWSSPFCCIARMVTAKGPIIKSWNASLYQAAPAGCRLPCDSLFSSLLWFTTNCCCCIHCGGDRPSLPTAGTSSSLLKLSLSFNQSFKGAGASLFRAAFLSRDPGELAAHRRGWGAGCFGRGWSDCDDLCAGSCWDFRTNHKTYETLHTL